MIKTIFALLTASSVAFGDGISHNGFSESAVEAENLEAYSGTEFIKALCSLPRGTLYIRGTVLGWPNTNDISTLINMLDDKSPCRSVASFRSSWMGDGVSSVGQEVAFLLLGIKTGHYPPKLNSTRDTESVNREIQDWLSTWNMKTDQIQTEPAHY